MSADTRPRTWHLVEVPAPPVAADDDWPWRWVYEGYSNLRREAELEVWGHSDRWAPTPILMAFLADTPYRRTLVVAAVSDGGDGEPGAVLGVVEVGQPLQDDTHLSMVSLCVAAAARRQGIGTALADAAEELAARSGRKVAIGWSFHAPEPEPGPGVLTAPTGSGRVPAGDPAARFARDRGFTLEQVSRASTLQVPHTGADVEPHLAAALAKAGPEYRLHTWIGTVPEEYHERLAVIWARMSTDAPSAGLEFEEQVWDAQRVATHLADLAQARQQIILTAAEHVPTGTLVAFTELEVPDFDPVDFGFQGDTLVVADHRGRSLGMLVKATNLLRLIQERPKVRRIHTWNAEENSHMLAINVALGFRGVGVSAGWQRVQA